MFTEKSLRDYPFLVKAFTGIPAKAFWELVQKVEARLPAYEQQQRERPDRQRVVGGGRHCDQPVVIRVAMVLTYLRLHVPQVVAGALFGGTQSDVSRDLRRLLPVIRDGSPSPAVWQVLESDTEVPESEVLTLEQVADDRVLVDATEQRVSRPGDPERRKACYSGKKKAFTLKTQLVTNGEHQILAISEAVPGAEHDKKLSDAVGTLAHLPDGCEVDADKGYQGLADQVPWVTVPEAATGAEQQVPRLTVQLPYKKPRGKELSAEQKAFNQHLGAIRVRVEHCIGWVKNWAVIATRFRCARSIYTLVMQTVCGLVNAQTQRWQTVNSTYCA